MSAGTVEARRARESPADRTRPRTRTGHRGPPRSWYRSWRVRRTSSVAAALALLAGCQQTPDLVPSLFGCDQGGRCEGAGADGAALADTSLDADHRLDGGPLFDASWDGGDAAPFLDGAERDGDLPDAAPPDTAMRFDAAPPDSGEASDGSPSDTGEPLDATSPDTGASPDATAPDTGPSPDATSPDTGASPDATNPDTGASPDATIPDAGARPRDTGVPVDVGFIDATTPDSGVGRDVGPLDPIARSDQFARALCAYQTRCEPARLDFAVWTEADCIDDQRTRQRASLDPVSVAVAAGRAQFNESIFDSCISALASADCDRGLDPAVCEYVSGSRGVNQACMFSAECAPGLWCSATGAGVCGRCQVKAGASGDCTAWPCAAGLICVAIQGGNRICVPHTADVGEECGSASAGLCRGSLQCVTPAVGLPTCSRPAGSGQACTVNNQLQPNCNIFNNQTCAGAGTCQTAIWVAPGGSCIRPSFCNNAGHCNSTTNTCGAQPVAFQPCSSAGTCATGHYCDGTTCRVLGTAGQACTSQETCALPLACVGTPPTPSCGTLSWALCN